KHEIDAVQGYFSNQFPGGSSFRLDRQHATKQAVRSIAPRSRFIHFATHGCFAPPSFVTELARFDSEGVFTPDQEIRFVHPGMATGLILAANENSSYATDDGVLT